MQFDIGSPTINEKWYHQKMESRMNLRILVLLITVLYSGSLSANFPAFDTTVTVKTYTQKKTDTTFIKLRNTGLNLAYVLKSTEYCPQVTVVGDFELKADPKWLFSFYNNYGDSGNWPQTSVTYYCDYKAFFPFALPAKSKYQIHFWVDSTKALDSIFTQVREVVNDSTFILSISAAPFAVPTGAARFGTNKRLRSLAEMFTIDGRRINRNKIDDLPAMNIAPKYRTQEDGSSKKIEQKSR